MNEAIKPVGAKLNRSSHLEQKLVKAQSMSGKILRIEGENKLDKKPKNKKIKKFDELLEENYNFELKSIDKLPKNKETQLENRKLENVKGPDSYLERKYGLDVEINDSFSRNSSTKIINSTLKKGKPQDSHNETGCKFCKCKLSTPQLSINILYKQYEEKALNILNSNIISDIIFNPKSRIRSIYKDCLIYDCPAEFLERNYSFTEGTKVLKLYSQFAANSFHLGPNYFCLTEKKYLFRNIAKKLKINYDINKRDINRINNFPNEENIFNSTFLKQIEISKKCKNEDSKNNEFNILIDNFLKEDSIQHSFLNKKALAYNSSDNIFPENENKSIQKHPNIIKIDKLMIDQTIIHKKKLILKNELENKPLKRIKEVKKRQEPNYIVLNPVKTTRVSITHNHCLSLETIKNSSSLDNHEPIKKLKPFNFNKLALKNKKKLINFPHSPINFSPISELIKSTNIINNNYKLQVQYVKNIKNIKNKIAISNYKGEGLVRSLSTKLREKNNSNILGTFRINNSIKLNKLQVNSSIRTKSRLVIPVNRKSTNISTNKKNIPNFHIMNH